ncbi:MAG TPA: hypothetical protein VGB79_10185 [Allosphingosinicella sp.]|jgi:hypothetical protein
MPARGTLSSVAAALLALTPAAAGAQSKPPAAPAPAHSDAAQILRQARVVFPDSIGNFRLVGVRLYGPNHVNASYGIVGGPLVSFFVTRIEGTLEQEMAAAEAAIRRVHTNVRTLRDLSPPPVAPGALGRLWTAEMRGEPVQAAVMIWQRLGWRIKIRATARDDTGLAEIERLIRDFDWNGEVPA